jgi:hypothetical protein
MVRRKQGDGEYNGAYAHVVEGKRVADGAEKPMNDSSSNLHAGINRFADGTADGVPTLVVEPGDEFLPTVLNKVHVRKRRGVGRGAV